MDHRDTKRNTHRMGRYGYAGGLGKGNGPSRGVGRRGPVQPGQVGHAQAPIQTQPPQQNAGYPQAAGAPAGAPSGAAVGHTSAASFQGDVLGASQQTPVLVDLYTTWCGPCKSLAPYLEQLASQLQGRLKVVKLDGDAHPSIVQQYQVRAYPTLLLFSDGQLVKVNAGSPGSLQGLLNFVSPHAG